MQKDLFVVATGVLKGIRENGHSVEGAVFVDSLSEREYGGAEPGRVESDGAEGVAEDVTKKCNLLSEFFRIAFVGVFAVYCSCGFK